MALIELKDVNKRIRNKQLLTQVSLSLTAGRVYGFTGPNGSGKTVLLKTVLGFMRPNSGTVLVAGQMIRRDVMFADQIGFSLGPADLLPTLTGLTNLQLIQSVRQHVDQQKIIALLKKVGLDPQDRTLVRDYSLGMQQRLSIAGALITDQPIIILDEPTNGLDEKGQQFLRNLISELKARGKTVLLTSHDAAFLTSVSQQLYRVSEGRVTMMEATD